MSAPSTEIRVGTAGWSLPAPVRDRFPDGDSLLKRYAGALGLVEINSSFYRPHRRATYERWATATPEGFRFAVKAPRAITHEDRLVGAEEPMDRFLDEIGGLGGKLGPVLIQLPPSLRFEAETAEAFLDRWRRRFSGETALEARHATWFTKEANMLLTARRVARVQADPPPVPGAAMSGGWRRFRYIRLHGSPVIYESDYDASWLHTLAAEVEPPAYVVFDNTKFGHATANALALQALLSERPLSGRGDELSA